jgi:hypothetical protein
MDVVAKRLEDLDARYRRLLHGKRGSPECRRFGRATVAR